MTKYCDYCYYILHTILIGNIVTFIRCIILSYETGRCRSSGCGGSGCGSDGGGRMRGCLCTAGGSSGSRDGGRDEVPAGAWGGNGPSVPTLKACLPVPPMGHVRVLMVGPAKYIIASAPLMHWTHDLCKLFFMEDFEYMLVNLHGNCKIVSLWWLLKWKLHCRWCCLDLILLMGL